MAIQITGTNSKGQTVVVKVDGETTTIRTNGFIGRACQDATAALELALGRKTADIPTSEMFASGMMTKVGQQ